MSSNNHSVGEQIRSGVKGIHGVGEAIRGTVMNETDKAFGTQGSTKNTDIANKGMADARAADEMIGHNYGIKTTGTGAPGAAGTVDTRTAPATSAGAHSTAPGNIGSTGSIVGEGPAGVQEQPGVNQRF